MKKPLTLATLLLATVASAANTKNVLVMEDPNAPLPAAFAAEKQCAGLTEIFLNSHQLFDWSLAWAGNGHGRFELLLIDMTETPHRYVFLGTEAKKGAKRACEVMNGKREVAWRSF